MAGRELTVDRVIRAGPDEVWAVLTDLEQAPETLRGVTAVEVLEGDGYGVGTRWRETRRIFGKAETQTMEVTECDPPHRTTVTSRSAGVDYRSVFTLEPVEADTRLTICFGASHPDPNLLQRLTVTLFGHVGAAVTTRLLNQDLADIAARAERSGSS
jgi:uncharacterized protein YndB with AHSA1/START domain